MYGFETPLICAWKGGSSTDLYTVLSSECNLRLTLPCVVVYILLKSILQERRPFVCTLSSLFVRTQRGRMGDLYEKSIILFTCGCIYDCSNCLEHNSQDILSLMVCLGCFVMAWWFSAQQRKSMGLSVWFAPCYSSAVYEYPIHRAGYQYWNAVRNYNCIVCDCLWLLGLEERLK